MLLSVVQGAREAPSPQPGGPSIAGPPATAADALLRGMVGAGQGWQAICRYLLLSRTALDDALVRLDLPTPHERPLRAPGPRGWTPGDTFRAIAWRLAGFHPRNIGLRLGRSPDAVRSRTRRLGVPTPPRASLVRATSWTLPEPKPDHFSAVLGPSWGVGGAATGAATDSVSAAVLVRGAPAANPILWRTPAESPPGASWRPAVPPQPDPVLPGLFPGAGDSIPRDGDLSHLAGLKRLRRNRAAVLQLAAAYFGGQAVKAIARRIGVSASTVQSLFNHLELPRDTDRTNFSEHANDALGRERLAASGWELVPCAETGNLFFRHRCDRAAVTVCRRKRFERGTLDRGHDRYRGNHVSLASL